jgi:hypothetical protein
MWFGVGCISRELVCLGAIRMRFLRVVKERGEERQLRDDSDVDCTWLSGGAGGKRRKKEKGSEKLGKSRDKKTLPT